MDLILGVDFGTTNTVVCFFENNKSQILMDGIYKSFPSKIGIKNNSLYSGNYIPLNVDKIIHSFKTNIDDNDESEIINDKKFYKKDFLIFFLEHIKKIIYKKFPKDINIKTVITVPSNFNNRQREIIKNCFNICNYNVIRLINEPSAAALAYGLSNINENEEKILVLDLGGGTMDISILIKENGFFEVEYSTGANDLGGNNFTDCIYNHILKKYTDFDNNKKQILWQLCQTTKEKLSFINNYDIKIKQYNNKDDFLFNISTLQFEKLSNNLINRIEEILQNIYDNYKSIKYIIMVGNTSKIKIIQDNVERIFKIKPWIHPSLDSVVASGACLYGGIIENLYKSNDNVVLIDVVPLSLGVETSDGTFSIIIPKNTPLPIKRTQRYTTDSPFDSSITIKIYQGERKNAKKNLLIGEYIFDKITMGGVPIIDITFKIDLSGIINVTILDKKSGIEKNILIKNIIEIDSVQEILKIAEENELIDDEEMLMKNRLYQINTKIELIINNIKLNNLIDSIKKDDLINNLTELLNKSENADNTTLLNILKEINENFLTYSNNNEETINETNNNDFDSIDKIILKEELQAKINLLLHKNPDWEEYLKPILDELTYSNVSIEYIKDKLEIIKELDDNDYNTDYKEQYKNLCLFIKSETENGNIILSEENMIKLNNQIDTSLSLLDSNDNENIDWEDEVNVLNNFCEELL